MYQYTQADRTPALNSYAQDCGEIADLMTEMSARLKADRNDSQALTILTECQAQLEWLKANHPKE